MFAVFVAAYPLRIPSAVLQGLQELPYLARTQLVGWAFGTAVTVVLVLLGWHLAALVTGWSVTLMVPALAAAWRVRQAITTPTDASAHGVGRDISAGPSGSAPDRSARCF